MRRIMCIGSGSVLSLGLCLALVPAQAGDKAGGKTVMPFNGVDLKGWKFQGDPKKSAWVVGRAMMDPDKKNQLKVTAIPPEAERRPRRSGDGQSQR
jgi:hypothetical protein